MAKCLVAVVSYGEDSTDEIIKMLNHVNIKYIIINSDEMPKEKPSHIILSGGPKHVYNQDKYSIPQWIIESDVPVLGICYGMQLIAYTFKGKVVRMSELEKGPIYVTEFIGGQQITHKRWMNRYDNVVSLPYNFIITGVTCKNHIASFTDNKKWWAVQYHPEAKNYKDFNLFKNFLNITPHYIF